MEAISSVEAEVSCSEAACWDAPADRDWLEPDTRDAAPETLSALSLMREARSLSAVPAWRTSQRTPAPTPRAISKSAIVNTLLRADLAEETAEARRNAEIDRAAMKSELTGIKVLLVDDEEDSVTIVRRILERRGALVRSANSMNEALAEFATFSPNVILSDIGMPGNDGYELISRLRAMPGGRAVPAVALTALARGEDRTRALHAGFQMHVTKPVDFNELVAVVQNLASLRSEDR